MTTYIALLRGINVGGRNRVAMADLRALCEDAGLRDVRTYVQSGNVVFSSDHTEPGAVGELLTERIATELDVSPTVVVRTAEELEATVAANPYAEEAEADPTKVHAAFLATRSPDPDAFDVDAGRFEPERFTLGDGVIYLHLPAGIGRSELAAHLTRRGDVETTVRNWRTVTKLLQMARG